MGALSEADIAAVRRVWDTMLDANFAMDWDTYMQHMTDDVVGFDPRLAGPLRGKNAFQAWVDKTDFADPQGTFEVEKISGDAGLACVEWTFEATWTENGEPMQAKGKGMTLYRHDDDGAWRMSHNAWNADP